MSELFACQKNLVSIFTDEFYFVIPSYQRPYAWEEEHAEQLFDDLSEAWERSKSVAAKDIAPYFLGSIVIIKPKHESKSEVVDGQQRLTTLMLLLGGLRDRLPDYKRQLEVQLKQPGNPFLGVPDRFRLEPRETVREFFETKILGDVGLRTDLDSAQLPDDSHKNMWLNAMVFRKRLIRMKDGEVFAFVTFILQHCFLVIVSTEDFGSAYRIFSVLNDRGMDLLPTDVLKAKLLGDIPEHQRDAFTQLWETTESELGRGGFLELFTHIRTMELKSKLRSNLLEEVRKDILPNYPPARFIKEKLIPASDALRTLKEADYASSSGADAVNQALRNLSLIDNADWLPPSIRYLMLHRTEPSALLRFFNSLERLAASMMLRRCYVNERIDRYLELLKWIDNGADLYGAGSPLDLSTTERDNTLTVIQGDIYGIVKVRRPLLLRLDGLLADSDKGATYEQSTITVEHVLPQNPANGSSWLTAFSDPALRRTWTNRLGNLVLLSRRKNSSANNQEFSKKKLTYFSKNGVTTFALTTSVIKENDWTLDVLEVRQKHLISKLKEAWSL